MDSKDQGLTTDESSQIRGIRKMSKDNYLDKVAKKINDGNWTYEIGDGFDGIFKKSILGGNI